MKTRNIVFIPLLVAFAALVILLFAIAALRESLGDSASADRGLEPGADGLPRDPAASRLP